MHRETSDNTEAASGSSNTAPAAADLTDSMRSTPAAEPRRLKPGILRLDINKPRRSSGGSVDFRGVAQPGGAGAQSAMASSENNSGVTSPHQLSVTWAPPCEFDKGGRQMQSSADARREYYRGQKGRRTASQEESRSSYDLNDFQSQNQSIDGEGHAYQQHQEPIYAQPQDENADIDDEEDYSISVTAIIQRRASVRGYRGKRRSSRRNSRRASSPMEQLVDSVERRRSSVYTTSSEEGTNQESTQEQIFENIRLHKEVIQSVKLQPWPIRKKLKLVRQAKTYVARHEGALQERFAMSRSTKDLWARFKILMAARWRHWKRETTSFLTVLIPWELRIKEIESHFGSGVASYFTFLRWLMWVNIMIAIPLVAFVIGPEYFATKNDEIDPRKRMSEAEYAVAGNLYTFWEFEGYLKYSPMFYGYYSNTSGISTSGYKLPLAYFLTAVLVYVYSFVATLRKMAENSRNSKLSSKDDECVFSWKLFTGWDFMIGHAETAHNRIASVVVGFKEALLEEAEKKKDNRNWRIILQRILVNILVMGLLGLSGATVVLLVNHSEELAKHDNWLSRNAVNVTMTLLSFFLPMIFEALGLFENWHPRQQLRLQLARIMILNMLNLYSLMFSFIYKINSKEKPLQDLKKANETYTEEMESLISSIAALRAMTTTPGYSDSTTDGSFDESTTSGWGSSDGSSSDALFGSTAAALFTTSMQRLKCLNITVKCSKPRRILINTKNIATTLMLLNLTTTMLPPSTAPTTTPATEPTTMPSTPWTTSAGTVLSTTAEWTTLPTTQSTTTESTTTTTTTTTTTPSTTTTAATTTTPTTTAATTTTPTTTSTTTTTTTPSTTSSSSTVTTTAATTTTTTAAAAEIAYTTDAADDDYDYSSSVDYSAASTASSTTTTAAPGNDSYFNYVDYFEGLPLSEIGDYEPAIKTSTEQADDPLAEVLAQLDEQPVAKARRRRAVNEAEAYATYPLYSKYSRRHRNESRLPTASTTGSASAEPTTASAAMRPVDRPSRVYPAPATYRPAANQRDASRDAVPDRSSAYDSRRLPESRATNYVNRSPDYADRRQQTQSSYADRRQPTQPGYADRSQPAQSGYVDRRQPTQPGYADRRQPTQQGYSDHRQPTQPGYADRRQPTQPAYADRRQPPQSDYADRRQPTQPGYAGHPQPAYAAATYRTATDSRLPSYANSRPPSFDRAATSNRPPSYVERRPPTYADRRQPTNEATLAADSRLPGREMQRPYNYETPANGRADRKPTNYESSINQTPNYGSRVPSSRLPSYDSRADAASTYAPTWYRAATARQPTIATTTTSRLLPSSTVRQRPRVVNQLGIAGHPTTTMSSIKDYYTAEATNTWSDYYTAEPFTSSSSSESSDSSGSSSESTDHSDRSYAGSSSSTASSFDVDMDDDYYAERTSTPYFIGNDDIAEIGRTIYPDADEIRNSNFDYCVITVCPDGAGDIFGGSSTTDAMDTSLSAKTTHKTPLDLKVEHLRDLQAKLKTIQVNLTTMCWETSLGQELSKVIVFDGLMSIVAPLCIDFLRALFVRYVNQNWCWDMEKTFPQYGDFKIAENILTLINNQGQVWMGIFFSPGLVLINLVKLMIMMYFRSWIVLTCNVPHEVVFKASKSNNFYLSLLLTMLFLCVLPVGYAIVWLRPSWHCGPFSKYNRIAEFITSTTRNALPKQLHEPLDYLTSSSTVIPLLLLLILIIYYLISLTGALREANQDLRTQLQKEREEERKKIFKVPEVKQAEPTGSTLTNRWRKVLEASSPVTPTQQPDFDTEEYKNQARKELISRIMKKALRKGSATSDEDSFVRRDDDDTDTEHQDSLPHDEEAKDKRFGLSRLQQIRRTRKPSLVDIVQIAKQERARTSPTALGSSNTSTADGNFPVKEQHPKSRFKIERKNRESMREKRDKDRDKDKEKEKDVRHKQPPSYESAATMPETTNDEHDPDTNCRIVSERRASLLRRKRGTEEAKRATSEPQTPTKEPLQAAAEHDPAAASEEEALSRSNFHMVDEKKPPQTVDDAPKPPILPRTQSHKFAAQDMIGIGKFKFRRNKSKSHFAGHKPEPEVFRFDDNSVDRNQTTLEPIEPDTPKIPSAEHLHSEPASGDTLPSPTPSQTHSLSHQRQVNTEKLAALSRQGRKKIGSLLALVREAVNLKKEDVEQGSDESPSPTTPTYLAYTPPPPPSVLSNRGSATALEMPPTPQPGSPTPSAPLHFGSSTSMATSRQSMRTLTPTPPPVVPTVTAASTSTPTLATMDDLEELDLPGPINFPQRSASQRRSAMRQDSQSSVWSDNIPTITISTTGSDECIMEPEPTATAATADVNGLPERAESPGPVVNVIKIKIEEDD